MNVYGVASGVESNQVFLQLANTADCALQSLLYKYTLLWMNDLVVTLLQISVNIYILDVQAGQMLEYFIRLPGLNVLYTRFILFSWYMFDFDLFLDIIHGIRQL